MQGSARNSNKAQTNKAYKRENLFSKLKGLCFLWSKNLEFVYLAHSDPDVSWHAVTRVAVDTWILLL